MYVLMVFPYLCPLGNTSGWKPSPLKFFHFHRSHATYSASSASWRTLQSRSRSVKGKSQHCNIWLRDLGWVDKLYKVRFFIGFPGTTGSGSCLEAECFWSRYDFGCSRFPRSRGDRWSGQKISFWASLSHRPETLWTSEFPQLALQCETKTTAAIATSGSKGCFECFAEYFHCNFLSTRETSKCCGSIGLALYSFLWRFWMPRSFALILQVLELLFELFRMP